MREYCNIGCDTSGCQARSQTLYCTYASDDGVILVASKGSKDSVMIVEYDVSLHRDVCVILDDIWVWGSNRISSMVLQFNPMMVLYC